MCRHLNNLLAFIIYRLNYLFDWNLNLYDLIIITRNSILDNLYVFLNTYFLNNSVYLKYCRFRFNCNLNNFLKHGSFNLDLVSDRLNWNNFFFNDVDWALDLNWDNFSLLEFEKFMVGICKSYYFLYNHRNIYLSCFYTKSLDFDCLNFWFDNYCFIFHQDLSNYLQRYFSFLTNIDWLLNFDNFLSDARYFTSDFFFNNFLFKYSLFDNLFHYLFNFNNSLTDPWHWNNLFNYFLHLYNLGNLHYLLYNFFNNYWRRDNSINHFLIRD